MKVLLLVILNLVSLSANAVTWYVDQAGTGAGATDGTSYANRFAGWADAWTTAADIDAGDTVYACGTQTGTVAFSDGGSSGNFMTIDGACPKGDGTFDYGVVDSGTTTCWTSISARTDYIFQNITFKNFTSTCLDMRTSIRSRLLSNTFIGTNNGSDTAVILGADSNVFTSNNCIRVSSCFATRGFVNSTATLNRIEYGGAYGTGSTANLDGMAIDDASGVTGCEGANVSYNTVLYQGASQGSGIDFQCSAGTGSIKATGNLVMYGEGVGITVGSLSTLTHDISSSISAYNALNQWYQKTTNTPATYSNIVGLAIAGSAQAAFRFGDGSSATMTATIRNSAFVADVQTISRSTTSGTLTDSHNTYNGPLHDTTNGTRTLAQWVSDGQCAGGGCLSAAPNFAGGAYPTTAEGFKLKASSSLIGVGSPLGAKYDYVNERCGNPSTIGAYCSSFRGSFSGRSTYVTR